MSTADACHGSAPSTHSAHSARSSTHLAEDGRVALVVRRLVLLLLVLVRLVLPLQVLLRARRSAPGRGGLPWRRQDAFGYQVLQLSRWVHSTGRGALRSFGCSVQGDGSALQ